MRRAVTALLGTIAVVALLAGCEAERGSGSGTDDARATGAPAVPESTDLQSGEGSGGSDLVLVDVRVAEADGFDRIVLEFSGTGTPGWVVGYVDEAVLDGSGEAVDLDGSAVLDIYASGTTWPAPDYYPGPSRFTPREGGDVEDVYVGGTFEGHTQVLAGIDSGRIPFRVFTRAAPARLVVEVLDEDAD